MLTVMMDRPRYDNDIIPEDIPLDIVYEDEDLMVINKPAGLVVHPGCGNYHGTLVNAIAWHLKDNPKYDPNDPAGGTRPSHRQRHFRLTCSGQDPRCQNTPRTSIL